MSHVTHINESYHTYEYHRYERNTTHTEYVMSHVGMGQCIQPTPLQQSLQHTATYCNSHCNTLQHTATVTATHCNMCNPPAPMNHAKIFEGWPAEMPLVSWYPASTHHFHPTDFCRAEMKEPTMLSNKAVPHDLLRRIRFWRIKSSEQDFKFTSTER